MKTEEDWTESAKRIVRTEMVRRGVTYDALSERLAALGVHDSPVNLRNKVARGKFSAVFMLQCLAAVGSKSVTLDDV
jgi:hypothetical protein